MTDSIVTKAQIVDIVAEELGATKMTTQKMFDAIVEVITNEVAKGTKVSINKFGVFEQRQRSERNGVNPQTGEQITIKASVAPAFKAAKSFKDKVSGLTAEQLV